MTPDLQSGVNRLIPTLALILALAACGGGDGPAATKTVTVTETPKTTGPATFSASGYIDVDGTSYFFEGVRVCMPDDGYDDVTSGAQVAVSSPDGDVVAVGRLGPGTRAKASYGGTCRFHFTVDAIPEGFPLYSVEVSHRGALTYTEAEMQDGLAFTLN